MPSSMAHRHSTHTHRAGYSSSSSCSSSPSSCSSSSSPQRPGVVIDERVRLQNGRALGVRTTCDLCRARKLKCVPSDDADRCQRCIEFDIICVFSVRDPIGRPPKRRRATSSNTPGSTTTVTEPEPEPSSPTARRAPRQPPSSPLRSMRARRDLALTSAARKSSGNALPRSSPYTTWLSGTLQKGRTTLAARAAREWESFNMMGDEKTLARAPEENAQRWQDLASSSSRPLSAERSTATISSFFPDKTPESSKLGRIHVDHTYKSLRRKNAASDGSPAGAQRNKGAPASTGGALRPKALYTNAESRAVRSASSKTSPSSKTTSSRYKKSPKQNSSPRRASVAHDPTANAITKRKRALSSAQLSAETKRVKVCSPALASPGLASPGLASPGLASPGLASPASQRKLDPNRRTAHTRSTSHAVPPAPRKTMTTRSDAPARKVAAPLPPSAAKASSPARENRKNVEAIVKPSARRSAPTVKTEDDRATARVQDEAAAAADHGDEDQDAHSDIDAIGSPDITLQQQTSLKLRVPKRNPRDSNRASSVASETPVDTKPAERESRPHTPSPSPSSASPKLLSPRPIRAARSPLLSRLEIHTPPPPRSPSLRPTAPKDEAKPLQRRADRPECADNGEQVGWVKRADFAPVIAWPRSASSASEYSSAEEDADEEDELDLVPEHELFDEEEDEQGSVLPRSSPQTQDRAEHAALLDAALCSTGRYASSGSYSTAKDENDTRPVEQYWSGEVGSSFADALESLDSLSSATGGAASGWTAANASYMLTASTSTSSSATGGAASGWTAANANYMLAASTSTSSSASNSYWSEEGDAPLSTTHSRSSSLQSAPWDDDHLSLSPSAGQARSLPLLLDSRRADRAPSFSEFVHDDSTIHLGAAAAPSSFAAYSHAATSKIETSELAAAMRFKSIPTGSG